MNSIIEKDGRAFRVDIECDDDMGLPWVERCGHGVISGWTSRNKRPSERALFANRRDSAHKMFYDVAATIRIARKDGWGLNEKALASLRARLGREPTRREIVAESVRLDFEHCQAFLDGRWHWVGVIVTDITEDEYAPEDYGHAVWGIESDAREYIKEVANELVEEILHERAEEEKQERIKSRFRDAMDCGL